MQKGKFDQRANERRKQNNLPAGSRLFITFSKRLPTEMLWKIFARYGPLENVYLRDLPANYGYAKYATAKAAQFAIKALNGRIVEGSECCVSVAMPQKKDGQEQQAPLPPPLPIGLPFPPMHVEYPLKSPPSSPADPTPSSPPRQQKANNDPTTADFHVPTPSSPSSAGLGQTGMGGPPCLGSPSLPYPQFRGAGGGRQ